MNCLRCGKETAGQQVFCAACLESMQAYPIKPDTAVFLPDRQAYITERQQAERHWEPSPEEQLQQQRRTIRTLLITVVALSVFLGLMAALLLYTVRDQAPDYTKNLGRNYTAVSTEPE